MSYPDEPLSPIIEIPSPDAPDPDVWGEDGAYDERKAAVILEQAKSWSTEQKHAMLASLRAAKARASMKVKYAHPAELAAALDPNYVVTPAIELISTSIERVLTSPKQINLEISMPPQEGKSTLAAVATPLRALQHNPHRKIILATYALDLAETHSRTMREWIETYGTDVVDPLTGLPVEDKIGLKLARGANKVTAWSVAGGRGGLVAAGIGSRLTGMPADLMIIDDPFKNMMEADSALYRKRVDEWFSSVARTRLAPDASIIMIQTRWHPEDLAGKVIAAERSLPRNERTWRVINIPAIAEKGIPDALKREPGTPMVSARDTPEAKRNFPKIRREVGERTWYALYQGSPRNPEGGIFQQKWFDATRLPEAPLNPYTAVVGIDPADSGEGDEAGIIGGMAATIDKRLTAVLTHDRSGQYTSDQWAKVGVTLALEIGARVLAVEGYTTAKTYTRVVREAYNAIHRESRKKQLAGVPLTPVEHRALPDLPPFTIKPWRGANKADAVARAGGMSQSFETGRARTIDYALATFEQQAVDWQAGQHQPDRVAAGIIVHDTIFDLMGGTMSIAAPPTGSNPSGGQGREIPPPPAWMRRSIGK
ncbi:terminase [Mycobacterium phage Slatt]|uniref:Terminase n=1 Tax=Mycobacterium phage Slatt TaxID=2725754 RepID=A0A6M3T9A5_9CAUD|nr:terminase [Mycobacterium phage Slatt]